MTLQIDVPGVCLKILLIFLLMKVHTSALLKMLDENDGYKI